MLQLIRQKIESSEMERTIEHCSRVEKNAEIMGRILELDNDTVYNIKIAARLHDIGKRNIKKKILSKPGKLSCNEMEEMKLHVVYSAMYAIENGLNAEIIRNIYFHHEDYCGKDGYPAEYTGVKGYPSGIGDKEIPLGARIIRVCDYFDALTNDRPYRKKMSRSEALNEMLLEKYKFDPYLMCLMIREIKNLC